MTVKKKQKTNWIELKQKYFESDIEEINQFLISFLSVNPKTANTGSYAKATKGWRDEKQAYKKKIFDRINLKVEEKIVNSQANLRIQAINRALENTESKVAKLIGDPENKFTFEDLNKIKVGYEILRLATGKSTANQGGDKENPLQVENLIKKIGE
ncbi:MAG: hypothetical protein ACRCZ2_05255 [Fusobacteriaceae bacterium]